MWLQVVGVAIHCYSRTVKAIEAAMQAKQWSKVVQIVDLQEASIASRYYLQIAQHYRGLKNYQVCGCGSMGVADLFAASREILSDGRSSSRSC